jgi:outer membrane protein OmpA-like peptidoglycan-associated protein
MPRGTNAPAQAATLAIAGAMAGLLLMTGCTTPSAYRAYTAAIPPQIQAPADAELATLASALAIDMPGTEMLPGSPGACGPAATPVVHVVVPEQVLFATASDRPEPGASSALNELANQIKAAAPQAELTVLGHTDAVGSDAYNMDLSKRRAVTVLRTLMARGLDPNRLSAIAIGKRQPIADNRSAEGRARNRRVEFLISKCLAANLGVVTGVARERALLAPDDNTSAPVEVMHLDPAGGYGLTDLGTIFLKSPEGDQPEPAALQASSPRQPSAMLPSAMVARPAPAPHYQPRTLTPDVERNPLGPAIPF